jgi:hypothetical protein
MGLKVMQLHRMKMNPFARVLHTHDPTAGDDDVTKLFRDFSSQNDKSE